MKNQTLLLISAIFMGSGFFTSTSLADDKVQTGSLNKLEQKAMKKTNVYVEIAKLNSSEKEQVLADFSLRIAPGESIALVGHTGAGKSSLVKLITRFYEFQGGEICLDGQDIRTFDLHSYRRHLGIVSQVPFLFSDTVANNIRYARPELTDAEIRAVARAIHISKIFKYLFRVIVPFLKFANEQFSSSPVLCL